MINCNNYINRHIKYIDTRINDISFFINSLPEKSEVIHSIIQTIIQKPLESLPPSNNLYNLNAHRATDELKNLVSSWDIIQDGDIVGYIYQKLKSQSSKKKIGQFFTPADIVNHIILKSFELMPLPKRILDPACGSGQFLISIVKNVMTYAGVNHINSSISSFIQNQLFGFDIDQTAVDIAQFSLSKITGCDKHFLKIYHFDFLYKDELNLQMFKHHHATFDLIIGNPPWCSSFTSEQKQYFKKNYSTSQSGLNTFTLFIERSFEFLKQCGILAFLIPEAYLNIKTHQNSRNFILNKSQIHNLKLWGEKFKGVFAPSISLIVSEEADQSKRNSHIINVQTDISSNNNTSILVPQMSYHKTHENIFNIHYSRKAVNIINTIQNQDCLFLKNNARFFLGIVTGNNFKFLSKNHSNKHPDRIIVGRDISQFKINPGDHFFKYSPDQLQQVAPENIYRTKNKFFYRFIGRRLVVALDREGLFSLNNVNGFISRIDTINLESILSILNSSLMQYYYQTNFFTIKVLRGNLEKLPIKIIKPGNQKRLALLVNDIQNASDVSCQKIKENIDDIIYYEYGIFDKHAYTLLNHDAEIEKEIYIPA